MTADVAIVIREINDALLIPTNAYVGGSVWVKKDWRIPSEVSVKIGVVDSSYAEVLSGDVHEGDRLMIRTKVVQ